MTKKPLAKALPPPFSDAYRTCYEKYSLRGLWRFLWDAFWSGSRLRKQSLLNRYRDYVRLAGRSDLLPLHRRLNEELQTAAAEWKGLDYGGGYFYQSLETVGITGLRDTRARIEALRLAALLKGKTVLEIGCHTGFLSLSLAATAEKLVGLDANPHLIAIAKIVAGHLNIRNALFHVSTFEDFTEGLSSFDAVLSFACHAAGEGGGPHSHESYLSPRGVFCLDARGHPERSEGSAGSFGPSGPQDEGPKTPRPLSYFTRCRSFLKPGGLLIFESHHPSHEREDLPSVLPVLEKLFQVQSRQILRSGTFLDQGRTVIVAKRSGEV